MKKLFLIPLAFAALASCSQHEVVDNGATTGETVTSYLAVNLVASNGGTRATAHDEYEAEFEEGTGNENTVSTVRFYFFDSEGKAVSVHSTESKNYCDISMDGTDKDLDNVEKILNTVVVLNTANATNGQGDKVEGVASVVAIVNPSKATELTGTMVDLQTIQKHSESLIPADENGGFVMSNSVYAEGTTPVDAISIANNLFTTSAAAEANPVTIFVERVIAKVRLTVDESLEPVEQKEDGDIYELATEEEVPVEGEENGQEETEKVYVKLLGWNATATTTKSYLMKNINASWSAQLFTSDYTQPWNDPTWHRSYWAINPDDVDYNYGSFGEWKDDSSQDDVKFEAATDAGYIADFEEGFVYVQENAALGTDGKEFSDEGADFDETTKANDNTKVIVAAQLVDEQGEPLEFAEYAFKRYTIKGVKNLLANTAGLYDEDGTALSADDIEFKTAWTVKSEGGEGVDHSVSGRYFVYAQLTAQAAAKDWYSTDEKEPEGGLDAFKKDANARLIELGKVKVWTNGYTYYTVKIAHIAGVQEEVTGLAGKYGVVRNHVYAVNIKSIMGLGTPVFDPTEKIIPENPEEEDTFCAAEIRILSWRIVNQDVDLTW